MNNIFNGVVSKSNDNGKETYVEGSTGTDFLNLNSHFLKTESRWSHKNTKQQK